MQTNGWVERVGRNPGTRQLREALTRGVARPIWWQIPGERPRALDYGEARHRCPFVREPGENRLKCQRRFLQALGQARRQGRAVKFLCPIERYALAVPVARNGQTRGYLALCHSEKEFPGPTLELAGVAARALAREEERGEELRGVLESAQPRAVALSTIHTIHRLISSTLNVDQLLPRLARLCCQVLRAQGCAIWLVDPQRKMLIPRTVIEVDGKPRAGRGAWGRSIRSCRVGRGAAGRVASSWKAWRTARRMLVPLVEEEVIGVVAVRRVGRVRAFGHLDQEILATLAEQAVVAIRNAQMYDAQERVTRGSIQSLSAILEGMDPNAAGRPARTKLLAEVAGAIAEGLRLPDAQRQPLYYAALLHDAGRVGIPEEILRKPSKLEPAEFDVVKQQPVKTAERLKPLEIMEPAMPIILHHHERYDGTGYPKGLKREAIPLGARILAVANAFEAMVSDRPYRRAMPVGDAAREIASHAGTQFDPKVVEAFQALVRSGRIHEILSSPSAAASGPRGA